jgi:DNA-binding transcriptional MerR regulator
MKQLYRVGEVAARTGVSIRTLHHYDDIELLRPSGHTEAGYRLYSDEDLLSLQQILTLRYLGFELQQIRELLQRPDFDLVISLHIQQRALRDQIAVLARIDAVLGELLEQRTRTGTWAWELVARASAAVQHSLEQRGEHVSDYYSPEEMQKIFAEIGTKVTKEDIQQIEQQWTALIHEVRANRDLDPASPQAQALADRWDAMTQATFASYPDDPKMRATMANNYQTGAYTSIPDAPTMEDFAFIEAIRKAKRTNADGQGQKSASHPTDDTRPSAQPRQDS